MVKTSRKCPTATAPVSGVLGVKALFLPSRLFYHYYLYNSTCTTLPVFPMSHTCRNYTSGLSFHCISDSNYQTEVKGKRKSEERGKSLGMYQGTEPCFQSKTWCWTGFLYRKLRCSELNFEAFWNQIKMIFETTVETEVYPWQRCKTGVLWKFQQKKGFKILCSRLRGYYAHENMHFQPFLFSLLSTPLTLPTASPSCLCSCLSFWRECWEEASMMDNRSPLTYHVIYHITASILLRWPSPYVTVSSCATSMHQKEKFEYEAL